MKKLSYSPPEITVVDFKVERGLAESVVISSVGLKHSRIDDNYYNTGEDYTEYTSSDGAFSTGDWI